MTLRWLKHELRTSINHIVGYSDMLIEEVGDVLAPADRHAIGNTKAIGREMLMQINAVLDSGQPADAIAAPDLVATLRASVQRSVERIDQQTLRASRLAETPSAEDIQRILRAVSRLSEFARTGQVDEATSSGSV